MMLNNTHNIPSSFHAISVHLQSMVVIFLLYFAPYCHLHDLKKKHSISFADKSQIKMTAGGWIFTIHIGWCGRLPYMQNGNRNPSGHKKVCFALCFPGFKWLPKVQECG